MELFHYHYWTDNVEEMENFYVENGFTVAGRFTKDNTYHPPLKWDDFREEKPFFRIIEVRKGKVNVTFGEGKKPIFDHIGYLVDQEEHAQICRRAAHIGWHVQSNERRTFLSAPFGLRVELQTHGDVVENEFVKIECMVIEIRKSEGLEQFHDLFGSAHPIQFIQGEALRLMEVHMNDESLAGDIIDPNGVKLNV